MNGLLHGDPIGQLLIIASWRGHPNAVEHQMLSTYPGASR